MTVYSTLGRLACVRQTLGECTRNRPWVNRSQAFCKHACPAHYADLTPGPVNPHNLASHMQY
jgi:hypothetical protein